MKVTLTRGWRMPYPSVTRPTAGSNDGRFSGWRDDANQVPGGVTRQARVAVERDAVAHLRQDRRVADGQDEAGVGGAAQQAVELLDLAALALPSHPEAFLLVPLARAMEQEEAIRAAVAMFGVQRGDAVGRRRENLRVARQHFRAPRP